MIFWLPCIGALLFVGTPPIPTADWTGAAALETLVTGTEYLVLGALISDLQYGVKKKHIIASYSASKIALELSSRYHDWVINKYTNMSAFL